MFSFAAGPLNATLDEAGTTTSEANSKLGVGENTRQWTCGLGRGGLSCLSMVVNSLCCG